MLKNDERCKIVIIDKFQIPDIDYNKYCEIYLAISI